MLTTLALLTKLSWLYFHVHPHIPLQSSTPSNTIIDTKTTISICINLTVYTVVPLLPPYCPCNHPYYPSTTAATAATTTTTPTKQQCRHHHQSIQPLGCCCSYHLRANNYFSGSHVTSKPIIINAETWMTSNQQWCGSWSLQAKRSDFLFSLVDKGCSLSCFSSDTLECGYCCFTLAEVVFFAFWREGNFFAKKQCYPDSWVCWESKVYQLCLHVLISLHLIKLLWIGLSLNSIVFSQIWRAYDQLSPSSCDVLCWLFTSHHKEDVPFINATFDWHWNTENFPNRCCNELLLMWMCECSSIDDWSTWTSSLRSCGRWSQRNDFLLLESKSFSIKAMLPSGDE